MNNGYVYNQEYRNGERNEGNAGIGGMLYSGECRQTFQGMSPNIPGNVAKHSEECRQIFRKCRQTFRGMSSNIPENVPKYSGEYHQRFRGMPTTGWLSNSTVGRLSIGRSFIKLFVACSRFYNG